jgi:putative FmdB family regulatory protein
MPIYEFSCTQCDAVFEELVRNGTTPRCPQCSSGEVRRLLSRFAVHSSSPNLGGAGSGKSCSTCSASSCDTCR